VAFFKLHGAPASVLFDNQSLMEKEVHIFSFSGDKPTSSVSYSMYDGQPVTMKDLERKVAVVPNCEETLKNATPVSLPAPGMKDIKRMELWSKWRPLFPVEERKDWFFQDDPGPRMVQQVLAE
jgi:hypothetical protein